MVLPVLCSHRRPRKGAPGRANASTGMCGVLLIHPGPGHDSLPTGGLLYSQETRQRVPDWHSHGRYTASARAAQCSVLSKLALDSPGIGGLPRQCGRIPPLTTRPARPLGRG